MQLWDDFEFRKPADLAVWPADGYSLLLGLDQSGLLDVHHRASKHGRLTRAGVSAQPTLDALWTEYRDNLQAKLDPIYVATRWVKHQIMHRPFYDANRRTSFSWAATHFAAWDRALVIDTPEAVAYKTSVRNVPFSDVYKWFQKRVMAP